jgi:hypothetical protein
MRYCLIVALVGLAVVAADIRGQPTGKKAGRLDNTPIPRDKGRLDNVPIPQAKGLPGRPPVGVAMGRIRVEFRGQLVRVESRLDVSNVVLEYADGSRQKFDDLEVRVVELRGTGPHAGKTVVRAWVKSGANFSGDGPGYGQRFEAPRPTK